MTKSFNEKLVDLLKTDSRFVDDEGELVKAAVIDRAWKIDRDLVKMLLGKPEIKDKFFDEIEGHWIFNINTFIEYVSDKNFLANSYTQFRNKIGLNIDGKFLRERGEVSLVWPYKDCVLEGGQTREEEKRKEIFFNEILAQDEIDRLFDPKVLTNWKRYTVDGAQKVTGIKRDETGTIRENLIIKGNNLLALHALKKQFRGKVKLIYIDPPFNTGNDEFGYNDNFNHSTWLTFMKNRLEIARKLLTDEGVIFVQCDDNEQAYLKVLMDEIFGQENFVNNIAVKMSEATGVKMSHAKLRFPKLKEYLLFYKKGNFNGFVEIDKYKHPVWDDENNIYLKNFSQEQRNKLIVLEEKETNTEYDVKEATDILRDVKKVSLNQKIKELRITDCDKLIEWKFNNSYRIIKTAGAGSLAKIVLSRKKFPTQDIAADISTRGTLFFYFTDFNQETKDPRFRVIFADSNIFKHPCDFWQDIKTSGAIAEEGGVILEKGKKPEKLIQRIIKMITTKDDIVLDYHLGSGTTCAVAHKMCRQYIGVEQLDYGKHDSVTRLKNVIKGDHTGISKEENWQGGGDFIYCELMKYNESFMGKIQEAKTSEELVNLWKGIAENSFLNWYVNPEMPEEAVNDFIAIGKTENGLDKQKKLLAELLNKNQLYVNLSEIDDEDFNVSDEDKKLNQSFYGESA
ncbi:MAG: site-specific DNA-methyltransferase [Pseudomonadota bacterium]